MTKRVVAVIALAGVAALPAAAQAAPTWLSPETLSAAGQEAFGQYVAVDGEGNALAIWTRSDGTNKRVQVASRPAGGGWSEPETLSAAGEDAYALQLAVDGQGNAIAILYRGTAANGRLEVASRPLGGAWSAPETISFPGQHRIFGRLAVNATGDAVAAWLRTDETGKYRVQVASRPAGGSWSAPQRVSDTGQNASYPRVAVGARGDAVVVWHPDFSDGSDSQRVQAAWRTAGASWSAGQALSEDGAHAWNPEAVVDAQGNAVAIWHRSDGTDQRVQVASRPVAGSWSAPQTISPAGQSAQAPELVIDDQGDVLAIWEASTPPNNDHVQAASRPAGGSWSDPQTLWVGADLERMTAAANGDGDILAVWQAGEGAHYRVMGVARPAGGAWSAARTLSEAGQHGWDPDVAVDAHGDAVAAWYRSDGTNERVQAAGYDASGPLLRELSVPADATVGVPVSFSASPFDVWSALGSTQWRFGDGGSATGTAVSHTYSAPGTASVEVTSADALGNASTATRSITIAPAPPGSEPPAGSEPPPSDPPPALDTTAPSVRLVVVRGQKLRRALRRGLRLRVRSSEPSKIAATARLKPRAVKRLNRRNVKRLGHKRAKRLKLPVRKPVARGARTTTLAGVTKVVLRFTPRARRALRKLRRVALTIGMKATDGAGNAAVARSKVRLRR